MVETPPATLPPELLEAEVSEGCPPQFVCLTPDGAVAVGLWIKEARRWMLVAWLRCGPVPEPNAKGAFGSDVPAH